MDIRTYSTAVVSILASEETKKLRAENERLRNELDAMTAHWRNAESDATTAKDNAAELGQALDLALAERDGAFAEVDALRAELDAMRQAHSATAARMEAMGC